MMKLSKSASVALVCLAAGGFAVWYILRKLKKTTLTTKLLPLRTVLVTSAKEWNEIWSLIEKDLKIFPVLGFDCEWVTQSEYRSTVSLVQLSSISELCVLVRTKLLLDNEHFFPDTFLDLLRDKQILKVGVGSIEDGSKLMGDFGIGCFGCVDLRNLVLRCKKPTIRPEGLKHLAKAALGVDLDKNKKITCSNWEAETLGDEQITYAARDSLVSIKIFLSLLEKNFNWKGEFVDGEKSGKMSVASACQGIVDLKFSNDGANGMEVLYGKESKVNKVKPSKNPTLPNVVKMSRGYEARKGPLYHNSKLYSQDGQLLCTCDVKKALWYLDKNLAEKMSDDPLCVRLLFEPSGRPTSETDYYLQEKNNICVVCGKTDCHMRKFVIPREYKKHLPDRMKEHKSHDVVLMCTVCHLISDQLDASVKKRLADKYNAKIRSDKYIRHSDGVKAKSAALALKNNKDVNKIPQKRIEELKQIIKSYFNVEDINDELIEAALNLDKIKQENDDYEEHGLKVMNSVLKDGSLIEFEKMWRQHFLDSMKPAYLPKNWSVDHGHEKVLKFLEECTF